MPDSTAVPPAYEACKCQIKACIWRVLQSQADLIAQREPFLQNFVNRSILCHNTFGEALAYRLAAQLGAEGLITQKTLYDVFLGCLQRSREDKNFDIERLAMEDMICVEKNDPACRSIAHVFLYFKAYGAIQAYRIAHVLWMEDKKDLAMLIQFRTTEVMGIDIHPGAVIGGGLMIDHGTGVVIGETCVVGRNCSLLHGVTLGGTGNTNSFDRHPKIGNNVFIGCQATILGNIMIGDDSTIGSSSLVLKPLPAGSVAVGSPAVIKRIKEPSTSMPQPEDNDNHIKSEEKQDDKSKAMKTTENSVVTLWDHEEKWTPKSWEKLHDCCTELFNTIHAADNTHHYHDENEKQSSVDIYRNIDRGDKRMIATAAGIEDDPFPGSALCSCVVS